MTGGTCLAWRTRSPTVPTQLDGPAEDVPIRRASLPEGDAHVWRFQRVNNLASIGLRGSKLIRTKTGPNSLLGFAAPATPSWGIPSSVEDPYTVPYCLTSVGSLHD